MGETDNRMVARRTLVVIGLLIATTALLMLGYETRRVLTWIVIAGFFAVALHPAVTWMTAKIPSCPRWLATLLVFVAGLAVLTGLITVFALPLAREGSQVAANLPTIIEDARSGRGPVGHLIERFHLLKYAQNNTGRIREYLTGLGAPALVFLRSIAAGITGAATIVVLSFLMVLQAPRLIDGFLALFAPHRAEHLRRVGHDCSRTITGYLTGNLMISAICGTLTYAVLRVMGVPYAGLIALFVGFADLIPLIGATLGAVAAGVTAFVHSTTAGIVVVVFFVLYQQLENHLLQPMIFARTVKLNPLTVLVAILMAVELAGILGALLAVPAAGILKILARDVWENRHGRPNAGPAIGEERTSAHAAGTTDTRAALQRGVGAGSPVATGHAPSR
ncbi:AI-2E family transporter [Actinoplanes ianthinogenes]|uniref:AI-2E family transporter n=1 Tax=Actinoplanes ianthinogenes TaxID=122358 RepID=A0ABM7LKM5_9ACTN|nr:AI-2E family transporter [Actinoplanes ianthinogenes]BCJ39811.1 AI-2E family transporter [Actinoplanes ianthinogenes]GGR08302.1 AI-2E family transporter [Actinoplanes ianthinogenes]